MADRLDVTLDKLRADVSPTNYKLFCRRFSGGNGAKEIATSMGLNPSRLTTATAGLGNGCFPYWRVRVSSDSELTPPGLRTACKQNVAEKTASPGKKTSEFCAYPPRFRGILAFPSRNTYRGTMFRTGSR